MRRSKLLRYGSVLTAALAAAGVAILAPAAAGAVPAGDLLKVFASDDTYASSSRKHATFGSEDKLVIGRLDRDLKVSFLKFVVPAGVRVGGARLRLTAAGQPGGAVTISRVGDHSWTEAGLSSANAPAVGVPLATVAAKPSDAAMTFDLGAEIAGPGTYSFALTSTGPALRIRSAEAASGRPELTLTTAASPRTAKPTTPAGSPPAAKQKTVTAAGNDDCTTGALLVPSCGVLWGGAAGGFTDAPRDRALIEWEKLSGRTATIFHAYHKGDEPFPTKSEIAMTRDAAHPRVLLLNWKIAYGSTWAGVARGGLDRRIDAFAARAKAYGQKFFLVLNHEPENDVEPRAGSGMQAKDFAAMYRHTILRLRAAGVTNVVNVMAYMGNEHWMAQSWWKDLYPGDDVVDWMGLDSYVSVEKGYHFGLFGNLLDRAPTGGGPGFYEWATTRHPGKPMMIAEWGAYHRVGHRVDKSAVYDSVQAELAKRPAIKALVHFDTKHDDTGDRDISIDSTPRGLAAFRRLAASPLFAVSLG